MKKILLLILSGGSFTAYCQTPNWTDNISCILYSHCTTCHNPTSIAPFSLLTYSDAFANSAAIKDQTQQKLMPPYLADVSYQQYAHQKTLTQNEIDQIADWVNNGSPSGDTTLAPAPPSYSGAAVLTNPDFTSSIGSYTIPLLNNDEYRCFIISNPFATDEYITAMEVIPGDRAAVHHVLIYSDDSNIPVLLDNADPAPGYVNFGGTGSASSELIGGFVPGSDPYFLPPNMGMFVPAGSRIIIQVHYPISASGLTDSTRVNFLFSPSPVREAYDAAALDHSFAITDGPLFIEANTVKTFHEEYTVPIDISVLSVAPHAHLICTSMTSYAITPANDTIHFENIPHWDFHWQAAYYFQKPIHLPAGTVLYGEATYDNTVNNPNNPNTPPQDVGLGESTTDEMMLFFFVYLVYQLGDENILVDTSGHLPHYLNCTSLTSVGEISSAENLMDVYPNPAKDFMSVSFNRPGIYNISISDIAGKIVYQTTVNGDTEISTRNFCSGLYFIRAEADNQNVIYRKLLIND